jgi:hypothetical protein
MIKNMPIKYRPMMMSRELPFLKYARLNSIFFVLLRKRVKTALDK